MKAKTYLGKTFSLVLEKLKKRTDFFPSFFRKDLQNMVQHLRLSIGDKIWSIFKGKTKILDDHCV